MDRLALALGVLVLVPACRVEDAPDQPIEDHVAMCCTGDGADPLSFTGCRRTNRCRAVETIWLRGPVSCGAVDESACANGRCCTLATEPPATVAPDQPEPADPPPAPAPIEPMPIR